MKSKIFFPACLTIALALGGCASGLTGDTYSRHEVKRAHDVEKGTVESLRTVQIEGTRTWVGPKVGAIVGGVAGSEVGDGKGRIVTGVLGATVGGLAGAAVEEAATRREGVEITVRMADGNLLAIVQQVPDNKRLAVGDEVRILFLDRHRARVAL